MSAVVVVDLDDLRAMIAEELAHITQVIKATQTNASKTVPAEIIDIKGAAQLLGRNDRQILKAVQNGTCPPPVVGGHNTSSWRWSTAQFLTPDPSTPARCGSGAAANTAGGSPTIKQEADPK